MTDRVYPSAKTTTPAPTPANGAAVPAKTHLRPTYRPPPNYHTRRRSRRSYLCLCCLWSVLVIILLLLLAAIAACFAYVIYSPRRPTFSVTAVKVSQFNLTTAASDGTTHVSSAVNVTLSAKNPNKKKIVFTYDAIPIKVFSNSAIIANGSFPAFTNYPKTPNILRSTLSSTSLLVDAEDVPGLRSDLKRKNGLPMEFEMETDVVVKMEKLKGRKVGIKVICKGIKGILPKGKSVSVSSITNAKCKVDLRIKIWKFTF